MRKILKIITFCFLLLITISTTRKIYASSEEINVHIIVSQIKVNKKEELIININIDNIEKVYELKLGILKHSDLEPVVGVDGYFQLNKNTSFTNVLINNYENKENLKLHVIKESTNNITYQNNVLSIKFMCINDISDTIKIIKDGITLYLFDKDNKLLNYQLKFSEKLNASWNILLNEIEVNSDVPDYTKSFIVNNRKKEEYELLVEHNIDSSILGMQAVTIIVIDKVNLDYLIYNKGINIVDKTIPNLTYPNELIIKDEEINSLSLEKYIQINDNYDLVPLIEISYYDNMKNKIESFDEFKKYLRQNKKAYLSFYGLDSSNNQTEVIEINVSVIDTEAPIVYEKFNETIFVTDSEIDSFDITNYFDISDNYDLNPLFEYTIKNIQGESVDDIVEALLKKTILEIEYYAIDECLNQTNIKKALIKIKDTIPPVLNVISEITLKDYEVNINNILKSCSYNDNLDLNVQLYLKYYLDNLEVSEYEFIDEIKKGNNGSILYQAIDEGGNKSNEIRQIINVIDTTLPTINILDIKDGGKYLKLEEIKYEVSDNFKGNVDVYVRLNGEEYDGNGVYNVGEYTLEIIAKDKSGNESIKKIHFKIIENNINGCMGDVDCFIDNYTNVIIAVSVLMIAIIGVIIYKIISGKKKKKKEYILNE